MLMVGIDETATMSGEAAGWCFVGLDQRSATSLEVSGRRILAAYELPSFHGREFGGQPHQAYDEFLEAIKNVAFSSSSRLCACSLYNRSTQGSLFPFLGDLFPNALAAAGIVDKHETAAVRTIAPSLLTLQRLTKDFGRNLALSVVLDAVDLTRGRLAADLDFGRAKLPAQRALSTLYNAHAARQFPDAPRLSSTGLQIRDDHASILIQAADVIGNFSTAYVLSQLGAATATMTAKSRIFTNYFDVPDVSFFQQHVRRVGNDLHFLADGALTFQLA